MANVVTLFDASNNNVGTFTTIQGAVNAAANGYTISASAGTYQEQVTVDGLTNLTIKGAGQGQTIILSPDGDQASSNHLVANLNNTDDTFFPNQAALVGLENGASVTIQDLTIDGNNQGFINGSPGYDLVGIEALSSSVHVSDVHVTNVWDFEPGNGGLRGQQANRAIFIDDQNGSTQTFSITGSTIDNFQKNGILMEGTGLTVNVNHNTVTGIGTGQSTGIAQNVIVVEKGATGSITGNAVSGIPDTGGAAILVELSSGVTVSGNTVTGVGGTLNSNGIYFYGSDAGVAQNNTISNIGYALADDGSLALFTTALVQDHNTFSGDLPNYYFFADPTSTIAWTVTGTGGPDDLEGGAANDVFFLNGSAANGNIFVGNDGTDTVTGYSAGYQVVIQSGQWVVTNGTLTDTLTGIEKVVIGGIAFDLVDQLGTGTGGFQSVQAAVNAALAGDVILANAGTSPVSVNVTVDSLTFEPSQTYTGITLTLGTGVHTVTLADYAAGLGTPVTVVANNLGDRIVGNDAADQFTAGTGADTFVVLNLGTTIDAFGHGDAIDLPSLAFAAGATATYDTSSHVLTVTSNSVIDTLTLTNPAGALFEAIDDGTGKTKIVLNEPPIASNGSVSGNEDTVISGAVVATDTYNDPLTYALVGANGGAVHGTVALNANGTFTYAPAHDFNGNDSFTFHANDGVFDSNIATESLTINPVNDAPVVVGSITLPPIAENSGAVLITQTELLANASDVDGPSLSAINLAIASGNGTLADNHDGTWSYTPAQNDDTSVSFSYQVTDGVAAPVADSATLGITLGNEWHVVGSGDFNGNSHGDFLWQNDNGQAGVWLMNGLTALAQTNVGANFGPTWHVIGAGDLNGDGDADILWQNDNGQAGVWLMNGTTAILQANVGLNFGPTWHVIGAGDFNGDGKADILWQNDNGQAGIWLMNGTFANVQTNVGANFGPAWHVIGTGDFNGDGKADILWQNDNGQAGVWLMNGTSPTVQTTVGDNFGPAWHVIGTGDFNGDGKADILWQNDNGQAGIWLMNGTAPIAQTTVGANFGPAWHVIGAADFNGDGMADILWQNDNGQAGVWLMHGTTPILQTDVGFNPDLLLH
jgi:parallel beta-helix repeat protein